MSFRMGLYSFKEACLSSPSQGRAGGQVGHTSDLQVQKCLVKGVLQHSELLLGHHPNGSVPDFTSLRLTVTTPQNGRLAGFTNCRGVNPLSDLCLYSAKPPSYVRSRLPLAWPLAKTGAA